MKRFCFLILFFSEILISARLNAQARNDYIWVLGYPPNKPEKYFGGVMLDFNHDIVSPEYFNINCSAAETAIFCDKYGNLKCYSDGCRMYNSLNEIVFGGDSLSYGETWEEFKNYGYPGAQNHLMLSWPGDSSRIILLHLRTEDDLSTNTILFSTIKFNEKNPYGLVTEKNKFLLTPGLSFLLTATRHANGRDWWIIFPESKTNRFFSILIDPNGPSLIDTQKIGSPWGAIESIGQAIFSPDGSKYIRFNPWKGLDIFEFDRCTGLLSNPIESGPFSDPIQEAGGVAVSPDSRYLYVANNTSLYQFDLFAQDILASKILIGTYDGYLNPFSTTFYQMMLAPDGKIYMFATNGVKSIHVINHPELPGMACGFVQHQMELPAYINFGSINLPCFRLGPDDGSPCDTLGINNLPIADFRYEIDSLNPLLVHFRNLSYFEPETFHWTFGNNVTSDLKDPASIDYNAKGIYEVCLTVANQYGNNTFCRTLDLKDSITSIDDVILSNEFQIQPNPFANEFSVTAPIDFSDADFTLYTSLGVIVLRAPLHKKENTFLLTNTPNGFYFYSISQKGKVLQTGKLVKTE